MKNYKVFLKLFALTGRAGHGLDYLLKRFFQETYVFSQNVFFFSGKLWENDCFALFSAVLFAASKKQEIA